MRFEGHREVTAMNLNLGLGPQVDEKQGKGKEQEGLTRKMGFCDANE